MKKACACILMFLFLLNGSLGELLKLPALFAHFTEHRNANHTIDLLEFLEMHYLGDDQNDTDQERDMELPFKKIDTDTSLQLAAVPTDKKIGFLRTTFGLQKTKYAARQDVNFSDPALDGLFRPPCC